MLQPTTCRAAAHLCVGTRSFQRRLLHTEPLGIVKALRLPHGLHEEAPGLTTALHSTRPCCTGKAGMTAA